MQMVAIDPKTGLQIRMATAEETAAYNAGNVRKHFERPILVGNVLIDEDNGPGIWFGGAGF